jgi:hypothetical protein
VATRAAAHEPRIVACVADPYVADSDAILSILHRPDIGAIVEGPQTVPGQAEQTTRFYEGEPGRGYPRMVAEPQQIRCPLLCLNDPSDNEELRQQAAGRQQPPGIFQGELQVIGADLGQLALQPQPVQAKPHVVSGRQHEPQLRRSAHHQQLELPRRLRVEFVHIIDHQPQPVL